MYFGVEHYEAVYKRVQAVYKLNKKRSNINIIDIFRSFDFFSETKNIVSVYKKVPSSDGFLVEICNYLKFIFKKIFAWNARKLRRKSSNRQSRDVGCSTI